MTIQELLGRLEKVRKTNEGWRARCPAHEDREPSLSIAIGAKNAILLRCFAQCPTEAVLDALGLRLSDLFAEPLQSPRTPNEKGTACLPARDVPAVAQWLRETRGFPDAEIARMWATKSGSGPAVVFRYLSETGELLYEKLRPIRDKKFFRRPAGKTAVLYGLEDLHRHSGQQRVVIVEGELDVHALRSQGIGPCVSVPDGCGSRVTRELVAPLARFRQVLIATDADEPGEKLAQRLAEVLLPERCLRVRFVDKEPPRHG